MKKYAIRICRIMFSVLFIAVGSAYLGATPFQENPEKQLTPVINSPSSIGDVAFPHQFHSEELEIECLSCHHETNAATLGMPHEEYFNDFWIDCRICHKGDGTAVSQPQSCSNCHHDSPTDIADETLSSKVVVHKKCWECHEIQKGESASQSCSTCHIKNQDENRLG